MEGEFIKECILDIADIICPENKKKFENISLSRRTVVRRIDAVSEDLTDQLLNKIKTFKWFSLALDESTDIQDTAQLLIFIRGIDDKFLITEELLSLEHLKDTTTGQDLFDNVSKCLDRFALSLDKLASVTTDGAPSLTGKNVGLIRKINDQVQNLHPGQTILSFHCIIHQENLCKVALDFKHVIDPVVSAVNIIRVRGLNHRQFKSFLEDLESEHSDVLYHTNVRWLSLGKVLKRVWNLRDEIVLFLEMKDITTVEFTTQMKNTEWLSDFAFAVDILDRLNELNVKLQGKGVFAHELFAEIKFFQVKLVLFSRQLKEQNFAHFQTLKTQMVFLQCARKYSKQISSLKEEFSRRFSDFQALEDQFVLLTTPFSYDIDKASTDLQLELIDLQNDNIIKENFKDMDLQTFYASLKKDKFPNIQHFAMKMFVLFASTYICEQTFSCMNINKSKYRSQLTDTNLDSILRISTSTLTPNYEKLVKDCLQLQKSH